MMPPPAMTTSALSMPEHAPELEDQLECGQRRDVLVIERRRHLDDVDADELRARGRDAQEVERLARAEPAAGRDLSPRRERRIERVDVERDVKALAVERIRDHPRRAAVARQLRG